MRKPASTGSTSPVVLAAPAPSHQAASATASGSIVAANAAVSQRCPRGLCGLCGITRFAQARHQPGRFDKTRCDGVDADSRPERTRQPYRQCIQRALAVHAGQRRASAHDRRHRRDVDDGTARRRLQQRREGARELLSANDVDGVDGLEVIGALTRLGRSSRSLRSHEKDTLPSQDNLR